MSRISGGLVHVMPADLANALRQEMEVLPLWKI